MDKENPDHLAGDDFPIIADAPARRVLVVLHQAHSTAGRIGERLQRRGYQLDIRRTALGDPLPARLDGHDAVAIFGGPMSVNDPLPWLKLEIDLAARAMARNMPILGICLGGQIMAAALAARVCGHAEGFCEVGYYPVVPTAAGADLLTWPTHVYHWHSEGFDLPSGAELLASGETFPNQAFRYGRNAFALQFHPEVTQEMMCRWTASKSPFLSRPGAHPGDRHLADWSRFDPAVCRWLDHFLDAWLSVGVTGVR